MEFFEKDNPRKLIEYENLIPYLVKTLLEIVILIISINYKEEMKIYKPAKWISWYLFFGGLFCIWISYISFYLPIFSVIFGLMALGCFYSIIKMKTIKVSDQSIEISSRIGNKEKIDIDDIESYLEIRRTLSPSIFSDSERRGLAELIIFTKYGKHRINSIAYKNYDSLKEELIKGKKTNTNYEKVIENKEENILLILLIILSIFFMFIYLFTKENIECLIIGIIVFTFTVSLIITKNIKRKI